MSDDDPRLAEPPKKANKEQIAKALASLPPEELFDVYARTVLLPDQPSRVAYTILRDIYLGRNPDFWSTVLNAPAPGAPPADFTEWGHRLRKLLDERQELEGWFKKPDPAMSLESALKMIEGSKSKIWTDKVMSMVGKRPRTGRPPVKRWLALWALDFKCYEPDISLMQVTREICQCGKAKHDAGCREQLRQQINMLVKLFRQFGYDFTWDNIKTNRGWKKLS